MVAVPSFLGSDWERIPEGSAFFLEQMRQSLTVSIPWLCRGTRKSTLWNEEVL
ncbi:hypothetical protein [Nostoc sp.]|uniref:hypothetical protein n=1 Tax=Nostoc sp. TaxID=1180 RepID=UPI002FFA410F